MKYPDPFDYPHHLDDEQKDRRQSKPPIEDVLNSLKIIWDKSPELRFGQLISNLINCSDNKLFYIEDEKILKLIDDELSKKENAQ